MKKALIYISILVLLAPAACTSDKKPVEHKPDTNLKAGALKRSELGNHEVLNDWLSYYRSIGQHFSAGKFIRESEMPLEDMQGTVEGIFDRDFKKEYTEFLVYSPDRQWYVDFDSYNWTIDDRNAALYEADQEINLVSIPEKTVTRIGFRGPSQWVEDAYWKNDSVIVLLENAGNNYPVISLIDLSNNRCTTYKYEDTLRLASEYSKMRLKRKGILTE